MSNSANNKGRRLSGELHRVVWMAALVGGAAAAVYAMAPCFSPGECRGGDHRGLTLGALGFAGIIISVLYLVRKDKPRLALFSLHQWLYAHVVIGTLSLYLIVGHSGFNLGNTVAALALLFLALTVFTGVIGMFLFNYLPRAQARNEAAVLIPDDLCERLSRVHEEIRELCLQKGAVWTELYHELVVPLYTARLGKKLPAPDVSPWEERIKEQDREDFVDLAVKIETAHDLLVLLGMNMRFRWFVRGWLILHLPSTLGLLVFSAVHIISVLWYGV
ncbi:MAG: hypothetical protein R6V10_05080 [bacterium]